MKDLYYYTCDWEVYIILSIDPDKYCRYIHADSCLDTYLFNYMDYDADEDEKIKKAKEILETMVEDDSSWDDDVPYDAFMDELKSDHVKILAHIKADI